MYFCRRHFLKTSFVCRKAFWKTFYYWKHWNIYFFLFFIFCISPLWNNRFLFWKTVFENSFILKKIIISLWKRFCIENSFIKQFWKTVSEIRFFILKQFYNKKFYISLKNSFTKTVSENRFLFLKQFYIS